MKNPILKRPVFLAVFVFFFTSVLVSCGDELLDSDEYDLDKVKVTSDMALPLASGDLSISDLLTQPEFVRVYPDGLVYLLYDDTQELSDIRDMVKFPDKEFSKTLSPSLPMQTLAARATEREIRSQNVDFDFAFDPESIDEIKFKQGTELVLSLNFTPYSIATDYLEIEFSLPNFKKDGVALVRRVDASGQVTIPLEGYVAILNDNQFSATVKLIEKPHPASLQITQSTAIDFSAGFHSINFEYAKGFFGDRSPENTHERTISITPFGSSLNDAEVSFGDPKLFFTVISDYGIVTRINFTPLEALKESGEAMPILFNQANPITISSPDVLGESATTELTITNAKQVFDFVPESLRYGIDLRINPGLTGGSNFLADTSKLRVNVRAELPLYAKANNIIISDTMDIDLGDAEETEIESASLRIKAKNQLPLDGLLQIYLANDRGVIIDSLFADGRAEVIKSSTVDASGNLKEAGISDTNIPLNDAKLKRLFDARQLIIKALMNTAKESDGSQNYVQFKTDYKLNINIGLQAKLNLEVEL